MSDRLIVLYKYPGVSPFGVRETWRPIFYNIVIKVAGQESTMSCQDDQLCAGLKARIDVAVHRV